MIAKSESDGVGRYKLSPANRCGDTLGVTSQLLTRQSCPAIKRTRRHSIQLAKPAYKRATTTLIPSESDASGYHDTAAVQTIEGPELDSVQCISRLEAATECHLFLPGWATVLNIAPRSEPLEQPLETDQSPGSLRFFVAQLCSCTFPLIH